jgi:hypothetical protein
MASNVMAFGQSLHLSPARTPTFVRPDHSRVTATFGRRNFELDEVDGVEEYCGVIRFREVDFCREGSLAFRLVDVPGRICCAPFDQVRQIHKNGRPVWYQSQKAK